MKKLSLMASDFGMKEFEVEIHYSCDGKSGFIKRKIWAADVETATANAKKSVRSQMGAGFAVKTVKEVIPA